MVVKPASLGGGTAPAKQNHDYTGLSAINDSTEAYLNVNHELSSIPLRLPGFSLGKMNSRTIGGEY